MTRLRDRSISDALEQARARLEAQEGHEREQAQDEVERWARTLSERRLELERRLRTPTVAG